MKADYVMTEVAKLIAGGETGEAVVPGKPAESYLVELVTKQEGEERPEMPPKDVYGHLKRYSGEVFRRLAEQKQSRIEEGN